MAPCRHGRRSRPPLPPAGLALAGCVRHGHQQRAPLRAPQPRDLRAGRGGPGRAALGQRARHSTLPAPPPAPAAPLAAVRERLADDLVTPPTLGELAALAGLSRFQLLRRFAAAYGFTPHAWLLQQRAERARGLIARGSGLAAAAAATGFADQSHMTRIFTRQFGFTPGAWQRTRARPQ